MPNNSSFLKSSNGTTNDKGLNIDVPKNIRNSYGHSCEHLITSTSSSLQSSAEAAAPANIISDIYPNNNNNNTCQCVVTATTIHGNYSTSTTNQTLSQQQQQIQEHTTTSHSNPHKLLNNKPPVSIMSVVTQALLHNTTNKIPLVRKGLGGGYIPDSNSNIHLEDVSLSSSSSSIENTQVGLSSQELNKACENAYLKKNSTPPNSGVHTSSSSSSTDIQNDSTITRNTTKMTNPNILLNHPMTSYRWNRQRDIAHILPVSDVLNMTRHHWEETFMLERRYLPIDWSITKECSILGVKQNSVNRDHRHRIVNWMSEACTLFRWASQTFFTAVHAWDSYMTLVPHEVLTEDLAKLSAACLYFGAQLVESAADENVKTLDEFTEMCPEVGGSIALREIEAHLVDTLQGISLVRRTPTDFLLLFLAQLQIAPPPCPQLFHVLVQNNLLDVMWDFVIAVSLTIYSNGLVLDGLPGSRWVAGTMLRVLEFSCPQLRNDVTAREILREKVFHMPPGALEMHQTTILDPVIKSVWHLVTETMANNPQDKASTSSSINRIRPPMPYDVIRHQQPPSFTEWPITFPSYRVVQDISGRLRAASFDTCTPPTLHPPLGTSTSASKKIAPDKPRRLISQDPCCPTTTTVKTSTTNIASHINRCKINNNNNNNNDVPNTISEAPEHHHNKIQLKQSTGDMKSYRYVCDNVSTLIAKKDSTTETKATTATLLTTPHYPAET